MANHSELEVKKGSILKVPFTHLTIDEGVNIREDMGDVKSLSESIRENGVIEPMRGWVDETGWYHITNGHRRYAALQILADDGITEMYVPFILQQKNTSPEQTVVEMFISNDGKPLNLVEQAIGVKRLTDYGWDVAAIAKKLAKSVTQIENLLKLEAAPAKFKKLIKKGIISATYAIELLKTNGVDAFLASDKLKQVEDAEESGEETETGSTKTKQAKITKKDVAINSFTELKNFAKTSSITEFKNKDVESFYWLLQDMAANKLQHIDFVNFFTTGEYEQKAATPKKAAKVKKVKEPKPAKAAKEPKPVKAAKVVKEPAAKKTATKKATSTTTKSSSDGKAKTKHSVKGRSIGYKK
jgi:ParB/RepB/Spo0J family partition protein